MILKKINKSFTVCKVKKINEKNNCFITKCFDGA